jgi:hypothetical protein
MTGAARTNAMASVEKTFISAIYFYGLVFGDSKAAAGTGLFEISGPS